MKSNNIQIMLLGEHCEVVSPLQQISLRLFFLVQILRKEYQRNKIEKSGMVSGLQKEAREEYLSRRVEVCVRLLTLSLPGWTPHTVTETLLDQFRLVLESLGVVSFLRSEALNITFCRSYNEAYHILVDVVFGDTKIES